ncbi:uncharacterized protein [Parasteatoda tepidariorum]|uniref:uncharacterized protein n=1 Tax=Parasteatoda tepidariorum TaxID=114398 RepID=UPI0039BD64F7
MSSPSKKSKPSFQIDDLILHPNVIYKLKEAGLLTYKSILHLSLTELIKFVKLTPLEAKTTLDAVFESLVKKESLTAHDLLKEEINARQQLRVITQKDSCDLFSGIYTGTITEISGESGCGKTQLCLYLSILAQLPLSMGGLNSKVVYIHSEGEFPIKRFLQISRSFTEENPNLQALNLTNNLILRKVHNLNAAMHILRNGIPTLMSKLRSKLIVIDSVASLLRSDLESINERTTKIQEIGAEIWKLANVFGLAVICVNQVSGQFKKNETSQASYITDVPSLGLLWSNILTTRMKISKKVSQTGPATRTLECVYSSYIPNISLDFFISEKGISFV